MTSMTRSRLTSLLAARANQRYHALPGFDYERAIAIAEATVAVYSDDEIEKIVDSLEKIVNTPSDSLTD